MVPHEVDTDLSTAWYSCQYSKSVHRLIKTNAVFYVQNRQHKVSSITIKTGQIMQQNLANTVHKQLLSVVNLTVQGIVQSCQHIFLSIFRLCNQVYLDNFRAVTHSLVSYSGISSDDVATSTTNCLKVKEYFTGFICIRLPLNMKVMLEVIYCFIAENSCCFILHCRMSQ
jgi:hypothetical protein